MTASPDRAGLLREVFAAKAKEAGHAVSTRRGGDYERGQRDAYEDAARLAATGDSEGPGLDVERLRDDLIDLPFARTTVQREIAVDSLLARLTGPGRAATLDATGDSEGPGLDAAMAFLRRRLVGSPPNVDSEDVYFASLLDEAEAVGRAATGDSEGPGLDAKFVRKLLGDHHRQMMTSARNCSICWENRARLRDDRAGT